MTVTPREGLNQSKTVVLIVEIDVTSSHFSRSLSQVSDNEMSKEARREGEALKIRPGRSWQLGVRRQVSSRHSVHLRVIDVYCQERWRA
jgi:hypothetical protein